MFFRSWLKDSPCRSLGVSGPPRPRACGASARSGCLRWSSGRWCWRYSRRCCGRLTPLCPLRRCLWHRLRSHWRRGNRRCRQGSFSLVCFFGCIEEMLPIYREANSSFCNGLIHPHPTIPQWQNERGCTEVAVVSSWRHAKLAGSVPSFEHRWQAINTRRQLRRWKHRRKRDGGRQSGCKDGLDNHS